MTTSELSIFINAPPQDVWPYVADPVNFSQWQSTAEYAEWTTEGPPGVGSTLREVGKVFGRKMESPSEITAWDPPNLVGRKSLGGPIPWEVTMKLEPKDGGTQVIGRAEMEFRGFFKIAQWLLGKRTDKQLVADFELLKRRLEEGQA